MYNYYDERRLFFIWYPDSDRNRNARPVKVKGYTRVRRGKVEKVRSHYRRVWTAR